MQKRIRVFFLVYILILVKLIVFKYPYERLVDIAASWSSDVVFEGLGNANFVPLKTIKMYIKYSDRLNSFENLAGNILAFVPFGMMFPLTQMRLRRFDIVFINGFVLVMGIEVFQLISAFGAFDVDDVILNCLGIVLGYVIYATGRSLFPSLTKMIGIKEEKYGADFEKN